MFRRVCFAQARDILFTSRPANDLASISLFASPSPSSLSPSSSLSPPTRSHLSAVCLDYGLVRVGVASLATGHYRAPLQSINMQPTLSPASTFAVARGVIRRSPAPPDAPSMASFPHPEHCAMTDFVFKRCE
jgi:hypothetical protein